jgi:hypothetical protein
MTLEELQIELNALVHQTVTFRRIAGNHIIVYFLGEPGDKNVISVFLDPSWRYQKKGRVVVGSYDFLIEESDFESNAEHQKAFEGLCALTEDIIGAKLMNCTIDPESSDLTMEFSSNQRLCNFANSGLNDQCWVYRNHSKQLRVFVSPLGIISE